METFRKLFRKTGNGKDQEAVILHRSALKIARSLGTLPYNWNPETQELEFSKSQTRFAIFVIQYVIYLMYYAFLFYRWIYTAYFDQTAKTSEKGALQYVAVAYGIPAVLHSNSFFHRNSLHTLINQLLHYVRHDFQRLPDNGRKLRKFGKLMKVVYFVALVVLCLNMVTMFRRPDTPHLISSLIPDVKKRPKWALIPFALVQGYIWCNQWAAISFFILLAVSYMTVVQNALDRTRPNHHLNLEEFYTETKKLEVLQGNFNDIMRWLLWTAEVCIMTVCIFGICGSIWNEGAQAVKLFFVAMFGIGLLVAMWSGLGGVFETSNAVLAEWRRTHELEILFRKRMRAMRPIRVQIWGYFYADAAMTLTLLSIISENTFNVLLAA